MQTQKEGQYAWVNLLHFTKNKKRLRDGGYENDKGSILKYPPTADEE